MNSNKKHLNVILVEPERFLHPNLNSSLVELISFLNEFPKGNISILKALPLKINILIETHSEYLIRSFQSKTARNKENNYVHNTLTINYLSKNKLKNSTSIRQIYIDNDGSLSDEFGSGFLDETELIIRNILNSRK
jgi:predicted ATPase